MSAILGLPDLPLEFGATSVDSRVSPVVDVMTPGSVQPSRQQSKGSDGSNGVVVTPASSSHLNSNGQFQLKDLNSGDNGIIVTHGHHHAGTSNGENQFKDLHAIDQGTLIEETIGVKGLPRNVMVDNQNFTKAITDVADSKPTATEAMPDRGSPKRMGVPVSVTIK